MTHALIDSHVHFWDRKMLPYPWLDEVPAIADRHTVDELRRDAESGLPDEIVFVECGAPRVDEVRWVEQLAARDLRIRAIVAKCPMNAGDETEAVITEFSRHRLVRGVRHLIQDEPDPDYCISSEFVAGVRQLGPAGLSFDICCRHHQLPAVIELVRRCPDTRFILDHAGKPGIRAGLLDPWREHIRSLASLPNVDCKLSGLITEADPASWTVDQLRPYVDHLLATFGPARLLYGSDWPVAKLAGSYPRWLDTARQLVSHVSPEGQAAIFAGNARRVYRLS
jgi:L-fuconolactonase